MSEEIKNTEVKETKRPRGKKANAQTTEQPVEQPKEVIVEKTKTETFDLQAIKRDAIRFNHCVFSYSDGFICHAVSRSKADAKHNAWLNRK